MRIYAIDDDGERFLRFLECDSCGARIKPHPEITQSGWTKRGGRDGAGYSFEQDYCPEHS